MVSEFSFLSYLISFLSQNPSENFLLGSTRQIRFAFATWLSGSNCGDTSADIMMGHVFLVPLFEQH